MIDNYKLGATEGQALNLLASKRGEEVIQQIKDLDKDLIEEWWKLERGLHLCKMKKNSLKRLSEDPLLEREIDARLKMQVLDNK